MRIWARRLTFWLVLLSVVIFYNGSRPVAEASIISTKEEISIGQDVAKQLEKQYGLVDDPELQERVSRIGLSMVAICDRPGLPYSFKVLNSKEVNAVSLPGGFIYVFKGLTDKMASDDELAGVIGHELGHNVKRHVVKQIEKSMWLGIGFQLVFGDRGAILQNLAYNAIMAGYSRDDEREADKLGFTHSFKAGYNPYSMLIGLQKLAEMDRNAHYDLFADHPEGRKRVSLVQGYMDEAKIKPHVQLLEDGRTAKVIEGSWELPVIYTEYAGYKPLYRAYFVAGTVYRLNQLPDYNPDLYYLQRDGENITVYYNDRSLITLSPQEAAAHGENVTELGDSFIAALKQGPGQ